MSKLFSPVKVGPYTLSHRVAMAPLTHLLFVSFCYAPCRPH